MYRLRFEAYRIRKLPIPIIVYKAVLKLAGFTLGVATVPVTALLHFQGYRHVNVFTDRIGHLALEPDCLLKEQALGQIPRRKWIMLAPPRRVANEHLLAYWEPHFIIIRSRVGCFLIANMSRFGLMAHDVRHYARVQGLAQESFRIYSKWGDRTPLLTLSADDCQRRESALSQLGLPKGAWFVCVHAREGGYSPIDESLHTQRNSDIESYFSAMRLIVAKGGWVIRIGDASMKQLPIMNNVIDYAHHPMKSARLDIILCASCKFILGSTSGICLISTIFGIPAAIANMVPVADLWYSRRDISIPKRIWSQNQHKYLSLEESLKSPHGYFKYADQYLKARLTLVDNDQEEIADLTKEMIARLGPKEFTLQDDIQTSEIYRAVLDEQCAAFYSCANLATSFFRRHSSIAGILDNKNNESTCKNSTPASDTKPT
jgi:putative glycosyltransferase (TIGR04372 family)